MKEDLKLTNANRELQAPSKDDKTLELLLPDWSLFDTKRRSRLPFSLWTVGDLPLLFHWLDFAVDQRCKIVKVYCVDRPGAVRDAMKKAILWPLQRHVIPIKSESEAPEGAIRVHHLPGQDVTQVTEPKDSWDCLDYWFKLERDWYQDALHCEEIPEIDLAIGRHCNIHPKATLIMPCFIGDNVQIGENCKIGPNVSIGSDSMLAGDNHIKNSKIARGTFMGPRTDLNECYLEGGLLINLRHRGVVPQLERFLADGWSRKNSYRPGIRERVVALGIWITLQAKALFHPSGTQKEDLETFQGLRLTSYADGPIWKRRLPWLKEVIKGNCKLFGVLPRTAEQLEELDDDWKEILSDAPVGVFSYADTLGCHSPSDDMESVHAVYQAVRPRQELSPICRHFVWNLLRNKSACLPIANPS